MLVSVIIPCFNVSEYVSECLDSVINQTFTSIEIICVDDGSTDGTSAILETYLSKFPLLIKILKNKTNKGASYSRNRGIEIARGEYIQFLDADDLLLPDKLMNQVNILKNESENVLIVGNYLKTLRNGTIINKSFENIEPWEGLINSSLGCTCSNLWPRKTVLEVGGWDESLKSSQEYNLMFRLLKKGIKIIFDPQNFTMIRERQYGSISQTNINANWERFIKLRFTIYEYLKESNQLSKKIEKVIFQRIFESIKMLYKLDKVLARGLYFKYIPMSFIPNESIIFSKRYLVLFKLFGFEATENIIQKLNWIFRRS